MKPLDQIRADVLAWIALSETTSVGEDYGHRILECLGEIGAQLTNELIEAESETEPENNGFISGAQWVRDLLKAMNRQKADADSAYRAHRSRPYSMRDKR